jgi:hypothetical protein
VAHDNCAVSVRQCDAALEWRRLSTAPVVVSSTNARATAPHREMIEKESGADSAPEVDDWLEMLESLAHHLYYKRSPNRRVSFH